MKAFGFGKAEKLKSRKQIEALFAEGRSIAVAPVRVKYRFLPFVEGAPVRAGVSVSRKVFKRAVDRNRLKRLMREAYRLQKHALLKTAEEKNLHMILFFIYTDKNSAPFDVIYKAITQCLNLLQKKLLLHHENTH